MELREEDRLPRLGVMGRHAPQRSVFEDVHGGRQSASVALDEPLQRCRMTVAHPLIPGPWRLHMAFRGTLNDKLRGFYRSTYKDEKGATQTIAATQFEATDARRAFPCWDEPDFKAVFSTTLVIDCNSRRADEPVCSCAYHPAIRVTYDWTDPLPCPVGDRPVAHEHAKITYATEG